MLPSLSKLSIRDDASDKYARLTVKVGMDPSQDIDNLGLTMLANTAAKRDVEEQIAAIKRKLTRVYNGLSVTQQTWHRVLLPEALQQLHSKIFNFGNDADIDKWLSTPVNIYDGPSISMEPWDWNLSASSVSPCRPVYLWLLRFWRLVLVRLQSNVDETKGVLTDAYVKDIWHELIRANLDVNLAIFMERKIETDDKNVKTPQNLRDLTLINGFFTYVDKIILKIFAHDPEVRKRLTPRLSSVMSNAKFYMREKYQSVPIEFEREDVDNEW